MRRVILFCVLTIAAMPVMAEDAPVLTRTDIKALIDNAHEIAALDEQRKTLLKERGELIADIESRHPGYTLNQQTGQFEKKAAPAVEKQKK